MKRRFEYKDEKSDKFWEYETRGASPGECKITWGRTGSTGQSQFTDIHVAEKRAQEKLSKGYVEVATLDTSLMSEQIDIGFGNKSKPRKVTESTFVRTSDDSDDMWDELIKNIKAQ